jgi:ABC-type Fe3+-siderophore transport system permease subunit
VLVLADIAARTLVAPQELATGAMTALVGAPLFIFIAARFLNDARRSPGRFSAAAFASRQLLLRPAALKIAASMLLMLLALGLYSLSRGSYPLPASTLARPCWRRRRWASSRALFCLISACRGS